ncbi:unnamed protein product [Symbiodinium sp. CCMP2456]|nr:unnamed protein product [Symbiodinium sp. CCMP2456]
MAWVTSLTCRHLRRFPSACSIQLRHCAFEQSPLEQSPQSARSRLAQARLRLVLRHSAVLGPMSTSIGHAGYIMGMLEYGVTDIWWLRVWAISGCGMVVLFQLLQPQCQWLSAGWCFVYVMVNIFQMMGEGEQPDPPLTEDERKLYDLLQSRISVREFADLAYYGDWTVFCAGDLLCERVCEAPQGFADNKEKCLYLIAEGRCEVSAAGRRITLLKPGSVVGEVVHLLHALKPTDSQLSDSCDLPTQVSAHEKVRCLALPVAEVQTLWRRRPDLHKPIIKLLSSSLLAKEGCVLGEALEDRRYKAVLEVACPMVDQPGVAEGVAAYRRRNSISSDAHKRLLADVPQCPPGAFLEHTKPSKEGRLVYRGLHQWFQRGENRANACPTAPLPSDPSACACQTAGQPSVTLPFRLVPDPALRRRTNPPRAYSLDMYVSPLHGAEVTGATQLE